MRPASDAELAIDLAAVVTVSIAISIMADQPYAMDVVVALVIAGRFLAWGALRPGGLATELVFFALCTLLGGFNDWNTVHLRRVYDYTVPSELPALTMVPVWMLVFWGMILRFVATLASWRRATLPGEVRFAGDAPRLRVLVMLGLVAVTRLSTYSLSTDPIFSWLPYAIALLVAMVVLVPSRREVLLVLVAVTVGPLVEALYIRVGGLHRYGLGWFFGVPVWIALWWALAVWVWGELSARIYGGLELARVRRSRDALRSRLRAR